MDILLAEEPVFTGAAGQLVHGIVVVNCQGVELDERLAAIQRIQAATASEMIDSLLVGLIGTGPLGHDRGQRGDMSVEIGEAANQDVLIGIADEPVLVVAWFAVLRLASPVPSPTGLRVISVKANLVSPIACHWIRVEVKQHVKQGVVEDPVAAGVAENVVGSGVIQNRCRIQF